MLLGENGRGNSPKFRASEGIHTACMQRTSLSQSSSKLSGVTISPYHMCETSWQMSRAMRRRRTKVVSAVTSRYSCAVVDTKDGVIGRMIV